jgi:hypothetical protein
MSKKLLRIACLLLLMILCLAPFPGAHGLLAKPENYSVAANYQSTTTVEVTFDGLMVFRRVRGTPDHYEVGILDEATARGHEFVITLENKTLGTKRTSSTTEPKKWSLHVLTAAGAQKPIDIKPRDVKPCRRLEDTDDPEDLEHVFDFCWIIDLEQEFHGGQPLKLKPNKLKPIILLNNGQLYAKYKYDQIERESSPDGQPADFGFVAETIGLRVDLERNERLVLIDDAGKTVFTLKPEGPQNAAIYNAPPTGMNRRAKRQGCPYESHFPYYYDLFDNVSASEKIDICPKESGLRPLNRWFEPDAKHSKQNDKLRKRTFDDQSCGATLLGRSSDPLQ